MENYETIKEQFKSVIRYSQNIPDPDVNNLFDKWAIAKSKFIKYFGDSLIYEYPEEVSFDLGQKEKEMRADEFIHSVEMHWSNWRLASFININKEGLFENKVVSPMELPDGTKIPKGMKLVRAFKYFEKDKEALYQIQNEASRIIQEDKISGRLCFSVHPLDFLSSSENASNWRSCHSLDGEYRAGNLSYMVDGATIVVYLKSEKMECLPNFPTSIPWNNKKWRMLLHFSENMDMMFAGRQYPFSSSTAPDFIKKVAMVKSGLPTGWTDWTNYKISYIVDEGQQYYLESPYVPVGRKLVSLKELIAEGELAMNFNDLLRSSCYDPIYSYRLGPYFNTTVGITNKYTHFTIGGLVKCLQCGKEPITISETMRCTYCEEAYGDSDSESFGYCACCGRHIYLDNAIWVHDEPICQQCADTEIGACDNCHDLYYNDELVYDRETGESYCRYCFHERED